MATRSITTFNRGSHREKLEPIALEEEWMCWPSFLFLSFPSQISQVWLPTPSCGQESLPIPERPGPPAGPEAIDQWWSQEVEEKIVK